METILKSKNGRKFEVSSSDLTQRMNLKQASDSCLKLGNGWRLPTIDELFIMYDELNLKSKGIIRMKKNKDFYWSCSSSPDDFLLTFAFWDGRSYISVEEDENWVRPVRDLK